MVPPASHRVPRVQRYSGSCCSLLIFAYVALTLFGCPSHDILLTIRVASAVRNPGYIAIPGLASFPFARRYLGNRCFFLFLLLLRCFSSEGYLRIPMDSVYDAGFLSRRVSPFGYLRVYGYLLLTAAFRSLSRPSSAPDAKSSSLRSY